MCLSGSTILYAIDIGLLQIGGSVKHWFVWLIDFAESVGWSETSYGAEVREPGIEILIGLGLSEDHVDWGRWEGRLVW